MGRYQLRNLRLRNLRLRKLLLESHLLKNHSRAPLQPLRAARRVRPLRLPRALNGHSYPRAHGKTKTQGGAGPGARAARTRSSGTSHHTGRAEPAQAEEDPEPVEPDDPLDYDPLDDEPPEDDPLDDEPPVDEPPVDLESELELELEPESELELEPPLLPEPLEALAPLAARESVR